MNDGVLVLILVLIVVGGSFLGWVGYHIAVFAVWVAEIQPGTAEAAHRRLRLWNRLHIRPLAKRAAQDLWDRV